MKNISTKELNYLSDLLSWELLSSKKSFQYANQESNPSYQQVFYDTAGMHQQNYTNLLNFVSQINNDQVGGAH